MSDEHRLVGDGRDRLGELSGGVCGRGLVEGVTPWGGEAMMSRNEVLAWLKTLDEHDSIGIDEGGLCLRQVLADESLGHAYCEVGGIPEEIENPCSDDGSEP